MALPFGNVRTTRVRQLKYRLDNCTAEQLDRMLTNGRAQRDDMDNFVRAVESEINRRSGAVHARRFKRA